MCAGECCSPRASGTHKIDDEQNGGYGLVSTRFRVLLLGAPSPLESLPVLLAVVHRRPVGGRVVLVPRVVPAKAMLATLEDRVADVSLLLGAPCLATPMVIEPFANRIPLARTIKYAPAQTSSAQTAVGDWIFTRTNIICIYYVHVGIVFFLSPPKGPHQTSNLPRV